VEIVARLIRVLEMLRLVRPVNRDQSMGSRSEKLLALAASLYEIGTCRPQVGQQSEGMGLDELQREHKTLPSP
jgi:hypothetical protein